MPFDFLFLSEFVFFLADFTKGAQLFGFCFVVFLFELFNEFPDHPRLCRRRAWSIVDTSAA